MYSTGSRAWVLASDLRMQKIRREREDCRRNNSFRYLVLTRPDISHTSDTMGIKEHGIKELGLRSFAWG